MAWEFAIGFILVVALVLIGFKIIGSILKTIFTVSLILGLILAVVGYFAYQDAMDIKDHITTEPVAWLFTEQGEPVAGFSAIMAGSDNPVFFSSKTLEQISEQSGYDSLLIDHYKVFLLSADIFYSKNKSVMIYGEAFKTTELIKLLKSRTPTDDFTFMISQKKGYTKEYADQFIPRITQEIQTDIGSDKKLKGFFCAMLLTTISEDAGPMFFLQLIKEQKLAVLPETFMFRLIRYLPDSILGIAKPGVQITGNVVVDVP